MKVKKKMNTIDHKVYYLPHKRVSILHTLKLFFITHVLFVNSFFSFFFFNFSLIYFFHLTSEGKTMQKNMNRKLSRTVVCLVNEYFLFDVSILLQLYNFFDLFLDYERIGGHVVHLNDYEQESCDKIASKDKEDQKFQDLVNGLSNDLTHVKSPVCGLQNSVARIEKSLP